MRQEKYGRTIGLAWLAKSIDEKREIMGGIPETLTPEFVDQCANAIGFKLMPGDADAVALALSRYHAKPRVQSKDWHAFITIPLTARDRENS